MLPAALVAAASFAYLLVLFAVAHLADTRARAGRSLIDNAWIYALSMGVYCTAWTYFGSVGRAASSGLWFLPIYLGPTLGMLVAWMVLRKMKDLVQNKFNVSIAQVSEDDRWQRAVLGISLVGSDRRFAESALDEVLRFIRSHVSVSNEEKELQTFGDELAGPDFKHWEE